MFQKSRVTLIQNGLLGIADRIYLKVEEVKISLKTSVFEKNIKKKIAFFGETIFKTHQKNLSRIVKDTTVSALGSSIINDQNLLLEIKRGYLERIVDRP